MAADAEPDPQSERQRINGRPWHLEKRRAVDIERNAVRVDLDVIGAQRGHRLAARDDRRGLLRRQRPIPQVRTVDWKTVGRRSVQTSHFLDGDLEIDHVGAPLLMTVSARRSAFRVRTLATGRLPFCSPVKKAL